MGFFPRMMEELVAEGAEPKTVMIDAFYLKAHRTTSSLRAKRGSQATDLPYQKGRGMSVSMQTLARSASS
jgi:hypothetical protein